ncbi:MAG: radical SAM protein [Clostridia bacterium]|nr:radical SAM protein [Clostridia bacterium]
MHLNIFVSQSCFVHCKGCYSFSREEEKGKTVPTKNLIDFLEFVYNSGCQKITLCGGDPLSREDIIELLERIKKIGFDISLDTVGSPIIKDIVSDEGILIKKIDAKKVAELVDVIGIPIDGSTNEIFRRFRQTNTDIINEQLSVCEELHKFGAHLCINTVAHKGNLEDAYELAKLIKNLDYIGKWQIFQYEPLGKYGLKNRELFEITDKEFSDFQSAVLEVFHDNISKLQFKSSHNRKNAYMLIDNSGNAWIPTLENMSFSEYSYILNDNVIIGNITNKEDWCKICLHLDRNFYPKTIH